MEISLPILCIWIGPSKTKKGGLILADNVFLGGAVYDEQIPTKFSSKNIEGMRSFHRRLADTSRYASTLIPTSEGLFAAVKLF
jgi:predicted O-methyltransferase YrrM